MRARANCGSFARHRVIAPLVGAGAAAYAAMRNWLVRRLQGFTGDGLGGDGAGVLPRRRDRMAVLTALLSAAGAAARA